MTKRPPTKKESEYMGRVAALGCAICRLIGLGKTPAQVHHPRTGTGAGRRASHWDTIPLCVRHHTGETGIHSMGRKAFEAYYDVTEAQLTAETKRLAGHQP